MVSRTREKRHPLKGAGPLHPSGHGADDWPSVLWVKTAGEDWGKARVLLARGRVSTKNNPTSPSYSYVGLRTNLTGALQCRSSGFMRPIVSHNKLGAIHNSSHFPGPMPHALRPPGPLGPGKCRMLQMDFRELTF